MLESVKPLAINSKLKHILFVEIFSNSCGVGILPAQIIQVKCGTAYFLVTINSTFCI
jgi:hypothetical protein